MRPKRLLWDTELTVSIGDAVSEPHAVGLAITLIEPIGWPPRDHFSDEARPCNARSPIHSLLPRSVFS
jgi:hypothetical protein